METDEKKAIEELRRKIPELNISHFSDGFFLRWLRANDGDMAAAEAGVKKHLIFRKAWGVDDLLDNWKRPEVLQKFYGYGIPGFDREGSPILFQLFGDMDVEGLMKSCRAQDYIKYALLGIEEALKKCEEVSKKKGKPFEQLLLVMDLENLTTSHYSFKPFTNTFLTQITLFQEQYPLVLKKILVIRAPSMARYAYSLLTPFLAEKTQQVVEMPGDDWKEVLHTYVEPAQWPLYWGGQMKDPNGDGKCPSKMALGIGPVPESYFLDTGADAEKFQQTTVYAGDKQILEFDVTVPGAKLMWEYKTAGEDIGFAVYYSPDGEVKDLNEMQVVFPYIRLECSLVPVESFIRCEKPGKYVVEFDNYYSWFSAKELSYSISVSDE